jgi:hypothetical protein
MLASDVVFNIVIIWFTVNYEPRYSLDTVWEAQGFESQQDQTIFSSPKCSDRLCITSSLLFIGDPGSLPV